MKEPTKKCSKCELVRVLSVFPLGSDVCEVCTRDEDMNWLDERRNAGVPAEGRLPGSPGEIICFTAEHRKNISKIAKNAHFEDHGNHREAGSDSNGDAVEIITEHAKNISKIAKNVVFEDHKNHREALHDSNREDQPPRPAIQNPAAEPRNPLFEDCDPACDPACEENRDEADPRKILNETAKNANCEDCDPACEANCEDCDPACDPRPQGAGIPGSVSAITRGSAEHAKILNEIAKNVVFEDHKNHREAPHDSNGDAVEITTEHRKNISKIAKNAVFEDHKNHREAGSDANHEPSPVLKSPHGPDAQLLILRNCLEGAWTHKRLADYLGVDKSSVYRWASGTRPIPAQHADSIFKLDDGMRAQAVQDYRLATEGCDGGAFDNARVKEVFAIYYAEQYYGQSYYKSPIPKNF